MSLWLPPERRLLVPKIMCSPGYPCCCEGANDFVCPSCTGNSGPLEVSVEISGFVDDECLDCGFLNGTYILNQTDDLFVRTGAHIWEGDCAWVYNYGTYYCPDTWWFGNIYDGYNTIKLIIYEFGTNDYRIRLFIYDDNDIDTLWIRYDGQSSSPFECLDWNDFEVSYYGMLGLHCDDSGVSSCKITAI